MSEAFITAARCHGGDCEMALPIGFIGVGLSGAAGLGLGTVAGAVGETGWREVPLDALATQPTPADNGPDAPWGADAAKPAVDAAPSE